MITHLEMQISKVEDKPEITHSNSVMIPWTPTSKSVISLLLSWLTKIKKCKSGKKPSWMTMRIRWLTGWTFRSNLAIQNHRCQLWPCWWANDPHAHDSIPNQESNWKVIRHWTRIKFHPRDSRNRLPGQIQRDVCWNSCGLDSTVWSQGSLTSWMPSSWWKAR